MLFFVKVDLHLSIGADLSLNFKSFINNHLYYFFVSQHYEVINQNHKEHFSIFKK
jgi:hypothetical protein